MDILDTEVMETENVPGWISEDISWADVEAIQQGGCASGAYMPAVAYYQAQKTMMKHGNDVLAYIQDVFGEIPNPQTSTLWAGIAVFYLSLAVDLWAGTLEIPEEE